MLRFSSRLSLRPHCLPYAWTSAEGPVRQRIYHLTINTAHLNQCNPLIQHVVLHISHSRTASDAHRMLQVPPRSHARAKRRPHARLLGPVRPTQGPLGRHAQGRQAAVDAAETHRRQEGERLGYALHRRVQGQLCTWCWLARALGELFQERSGGGLRRGVTVWILFVGFLARCLGVG
jgi:hypothetical protein